jgi:release factor glutamine methyltransferase
VTTWRELRVETERQLRELGVDAPDSEARWIVERVSGYDGVELVMGEAEPATEPARAHVADLIERRGRGEPLQYVLGQWQFLGLELFVDRRVLIPRPETEVVAQVAIEEAIRMGTRRGKRDPWSGSTTDFTVADLGTGSGALALALAMELPDAAVWATDVSLDALAVARANLAGAGVPAARVTVRDGSWFAALPAELRGTLRLVVANPPYVAEHEVAGLPPEVRDWEPYGALVSGPTGLEAIELILDEARAWLSAPPSAVVLELAPHQADAAQAHARRAGYAHVSARPDLAGNNRVLVARTDG